MHFNDLDDINCICYNITHNYNVMIVVIWSLRVHVDKSVLAQEQRLRGGKLMADDDRIREFMKLQKQIKDNPKHIAAFIKKSMGKDVIPNKKPSR